MNRRELKDGIINGGGKRFCRFLGELGWAILNGNMEGDEREELTYVGVRKDSVIVYVIGSEELRERVEKVVVKDKMDSDHLPVTV